MAAREIQVGMTVHSSDDEKLGKVVACEPDHFIVEKGFFFTKDYLVRYDEVAEVKDDNVRLAMTAVQLREASTRAPAEHIAEAPARAGVPPGTTEEVRVPLAEEELTAAKRAREAGEVAVHKEVTTEQKEVSVPVTKEEVRVEHVPAGEEARPGEASFQEGTVRVPVHEEEVEIRKRPIVREEVKVTREAHEEERRAGAEVRKETAEIERKGDIPETGKPRE